MPAELLLIVTFASPSCQVFSSLHMAAIPDGQTLCRGDCLDLAQEQMNRVIEVQAKA